MGKYRIFYTVIGSRNKKTGKLSKYKVNVVDYEITNCSCPAREFRRYSPCKHMKFIKTHCPHFELK